MKTKFNKSKIQLSGKIVINYPGREHNGLEIYLEGLKKSKSGVYEILNKFNGKRYIGMARDLEARKRHHWWDLEHNKHKSSEMQKDWEEFSNSFPFTPGVDDINSLFEFNVIIYCYPSNLTFYENLLISYLNPEYNTHKKKLVKPDQLFDEEGKIVDLRFSNPYAEHIEFNDEDCEEEIL